MYRIVDMREATSCESAFSIWDTVHDRFFVIRGELYWNGQQDFLDSIEVAKTVGSQSEVERLPDADRVVGLLPDCAKKPMGRKGIPQAGVDL